MPGHSTIATCRKPGSGGVVGSCHQCDFQYMTLMMKWLWLAGVSILVHCVRGGGHIALHVEAYDIPRGMTASGGCCDGFVNAEALCFSTCDPYFHICMDTDPSSPPGDALCAFGQVTTDSITNKNFDTFDDDFAGIPNPVNFSFTEWPTTAVGAMLTVNVWDDDTHHNDLIEKRKISLPLQPSQTADVTPDVYFNEGVEVKLTFSVKAYCDPGYHLPGCSVYCVPRDDIDGHYDCGDDGSKLCHPGWQGESCEVHIDECASDPCLNGGVCSDIIAGYQCFCQDGYLGVNCEIVVNACESSPCENGATCQRVGASFVCHCPVGFIGDTCAAVEYGQGRIFFKLLSYDIPGGAEYNGNCCDGFSLCTSACDPYFRVCLDQPNGSKSLDECAYGEVTTMTTYDKNNHEFGSDIGGTPNPLEIPFNRWHPGGLLAKIDVWDKDYRSNDDFIEYFREHFDIMPSDNSTLQFTFQSNTRLTVEIGVRCDPGYGGAVCSEMTS